MKKTNSLVVGLSANLVSRSFTVSTVNKSETVQLSVTGTYSDNSTKAVDTHITYVIIPVDYAKVNGSVLTALKDGNVTVQAKVGTTLSNTINLNVTWVVNGHVLPPEPDPTINNSTLLGVDVNDNGVRDDVERWIYETYKDKHLIYIDIAMQGARAKQTILQNPINAKEIHKYVVAPLDCESYFKVCMNHPLVHERINGKFFRKIIFDTPQRENAYKTYDELLSGDSYTISRCKQRKSACDFNTSKYEE